MNFESFLNRVVHNAESIIQWLFLFILALSGALISRWLLIKKSDGGEAAASASGPSPEISGVLQQLLERTAKLDGAHVQPLSPEQVALASTQVESLKKELSSREDELKALKAAGSGETEETSKLSNRLKELEAKLAEYEILEDDIADLSLYKEENVRLRAELDKLKNGGAPAADAPTVNEADVAAAIAAAGGGGDSPAAEAVAETPDADIVAEFAQAVGAESAPLPEMTMQVPDTGNPMKDFEAAVQIEQQLKAKPGAAPAAAAEPTAPSAPAASAAPATAPAARAPVTASAPSASAAAAAPDPAVGAAQAEADDLFAEFAESPKGEDAPGALDTDKMMAEMAALVGMEPSDSALEEGIDIDKMAAEASKR